MELIARVICIAECNYKYYCTGQKYEISKILPIDFFLS